MSQSGLFEPLNPWQGASPRFRRLTAAGLLLSGILLINFMRSSADTRIHAAMAAFICLVLGAGIQLSNYERQQRAVPTRLTGHRLMGMGFGIIFGLDALAYVHLAVTGQQLNAWVYDLPLLLGALPLSVGLIRLCWPPGTTGRDAVAIAVDSVLSAVALLVVWGLIVIPADPRHDGTYTRLGDLAAWAQYLVILAMFTVAVASRRTGSLPIQQVILLQLSVLTYVGADVVQHLWQVTDPHASTAVLLTGALLAATLYRYFAQRPALEDEAEGMLRLRMVWAVSAPAVVLLAMAASVAFYRYAVGPLSQTAVTVTVAALMLATVVTAVQRVLLSRDFDKARMTRVRTTLQENAKAQWFTALVGQSNDAVTVVDRNGYIVFQTPSIETLFGYTPGSLTGAHVASLFEAVTPEQFGRWLQESIHTSERAPLQLVLLDAHGVARETETVIQPLQADGSDGYVLTTRDVTDRLRLRAALAESDLRDPLTGLTNRQGFLTRLRQLMPGTGSDLAVLLLDIVGFRDVNDSRGHAVGDAVLQAVAAAVDRCPPSVAVAARFGADEFALVVIDPNVEREVGRVDRILRESLSSVVLYDGSVITVPFSSGYVTRLPMNESAPDLIERADLALAAARTTSASTPVRYERGMRTALVARLRQEAELREAIDHDRVLVYYQPIIDLATGRLAGVEALVRLRAKDGSLIPPTSFIGHAEELGLIGDLGARVLEHAVQDILVLREALGRDITVAVNVSADQIDHDLPGMVADCLAAHHTPARLLTIEVTESSLVQHVESASILGELRAMGCAIAIDDFGTGYSSLSYLVGLPVDELKIDRSFVGQLAQSPRSLSLVRVLLQMTMTLGLYVVAEGVETVEQADLLRGMGCQMAQGFLYAQPLPLPQLLEFVAEHHGVTR